MRVTNPMPQFDIKSTRAQIQIKTDPLRLKVERTPPRMKVHRVRPKMKVNWAKVRSQCGLRTPEAMRRHLQQKYRQMAIANVQKINAQAQQFSAIENATPGAGDIVAKVSLNNLLQQDIPVIDVASMPSSSPEIDWEPGSLEIEWEMGKLEMSWEGSIKPEISVTPHTVEIRLIDGTTIRVGENEAESIERQGYGKRLDKSI